MLNAAWITHLLTGPIDSYSLGCGKTFTLERYGGVAADATCETSVFDALDTSISTGMIVLLVAPAIVAALVNRLWMSVIAVAAIVPSIAIGLLHWSDYWSLLVAGGVPILCISLIPLAFHLGRRSYLSRQAGRGDAHQHTTSLFDENGQNRLFRA
ncbi:hypothetical protein [Gordonia phthalatica]|uniref:hypothetical protein n=1 Tax=Gordonia phthalatica TaxID=1136941 RepID=UPI0007813DA0|nr:hypothetical protein [Gordonia phthalatica]